MLHACSFLYFHDDFFENLKLSSFSLFLLFLLLLLLIFILLAIVPSSPVNVTAVSRDYSILVTWLPPAETNGMLTHYTITVDPRNGTQPLQYRVESSIDRNMYTYTITGLIPYQTVAITVSASTSAGTGTPTDTVLQRPLPAGECCCCCVSMNMYIYVPITLVVKKQVSWLLENPIKTSCKNLKLNCLQNNTL